MVICCDGDTLILDLAGNLRRSDDSRAFGFRDRNKISPVSAPQMPILADLQGIGTGPKVVVKRR